MATNKVSNANGVRSSLVIFLLVTCLVIFGLKVFIKNLVTQDPAAAQVGKSEVQISADIAPEGVVLEDAVTATIPADPNGPMIVEEEAATFKFMPTSSNLPPVVLEKDFVKIQ